MSLKLHIEFFRNPYHCLILKKKLRLREVNKLAKYQKSGSFGEVIDETQVLSRMMNTPRPFRWTFCYTC